MSRPVRWARMRSDCEPGGPGRAGRAGPGRAGPGGRIRKGNAAFQSRLGSKPGGVDALIAFGFKEARARLTPATPACPPPPLPIRPTRWALAGGGPAAGDPIRVSPEGGVTAGPEPCA